MAKNVRINLFDVAFTEGKTQRLSATIEEFGSIELGQRWRDDIRMEHCERQEPDGVIPSRAYYLEFSKKRRTGPGLLRDDTPLEDVQMGPGHRFGEETSALYVPAKKWLLVLNNHYGVGPTRMASYFNALDPGSQRFFDYSVEPRIDRRALERMRGLQRFAEVQISATVGAFEVPEDPLLESVHEAAEEAHAMRLSLTLHANKKYQHGGSLTPRVIRRVINRILRNTDDVDRLVVRADDEALENKDKVIDLLKHKVFLPFSERELEISPAGRYTRRSRVTLLRRAFIAWHLRLG